MAPEEMKPVHPFISFIHSLGQQNWAPTMGRSWAPRMQRETNPASLELMVKEVWYPVEEGSGEGQGLTVLAAPPRGVLGVGAKRWGGREGKGERRRHKADGALQLFLLPHLCPAVNAGLIRFTSVAIATSGCGVVAHS